MPDTATGGSTGGGDALPLILAGLALLAGAGVLFATRRWGVLNS
jgi:LPXTG-motif cell wall-anchored protein